MSYRTHLIVASILVVASGALVVGGQRVLERDREALFARYAEEVVDGVQDAANGIAADLSDIGADLDLAATLLDHAESLAVAERELHAIATIKREYQTVDARAADGTVTHVFALDGRPGMDELSRGPAIAALDAADRAPEALHVSPPLGDDAVLRRYRAFARRTHGMTIAVVLDVDMLISKRLPREARSVAAVFGPHGFSTPSSDARIAPRVGPPVVRIDATAARHLGLPAADAVAISLPIIVEHGVPWTISVVTSARALENQEATIVRRVLAVSGLVLLLLVSAAIYVIHNARRATALREQLRHADRMAHLTERAEKIVDHIPSGVLMLAEDRRVTGMNRWFAERFGRSAGGDLASVLGGGADAEVVAALVDEAAAAKQARSRHRMRLELFGDDAWLNIHAVPLERGIADVSTIVVFEDLTPLRRIEDRLVRTEKLVTAGQLAAGIAHEIGTPLNVARGRVELALSHLGDDHVEAANHKVAMDQIDRVTRLIQQLLDYMRPVPASIDAVDTQAALGTVRELLAAHAEKRGVVIDVAPGGAHTIRADADQIQQLLVNLTLNAIDACKRGGRVELRARTDDGSVVLEVRDDGHGIAPELQAQVFDPFFTTKKRGQGTGLGLWVVAQIVQSHAAEIELESAPGDGTTIRVLWPVTA